MRCRIHRREIIADLTSCCRFGVFFTDVDFSDILTGLYNKETANSHVFDFQKQERELFLDPHMEIHES